MKNFTFPVTVTMGSSVVRIYDTPDQGYQRYTLVYYETPGRRCRRTFANFEEAKRQATEVASKLAKGDLRRITLSDYDGRLYLHAQERLIPIGVPLDRAIDQFVEANQMLKGASLVEAARFYVQQNADELETKLVGKVLEEFIADREKHQLSKPYLRDLRSRLGRFAESFKCPMASIQTSEIERFLDSLEVSPRTRKNYIDTLGTLFTFAKARRYVSRSHPGVSEVTKPRRQATEIQIFTPEELATLLHGAPRELVPALAIGAFAGIRSEEIKRLDWSDINLSEEFIQIKSADAKTKVRRLAPVPENLRQWLAPFSTKTGPVCPYKNLANSFLMVAEKAGVAWKHNGLRHSFISYRVAQVQDVPKVALEAGNSAQVIFADYLKVVPVSEAERWFAIRPGRRECILSFPSGSGDAKPPRSGTSPEQAHNSTS